MKTGVTIFSDFLKALGVPHTGTASDAAFRNMSFQTLFGFSRLLNSYNVPTEAVSVPDKSVLTSIPVPFMAQLGSEFVIVTGFKNSNVQYIEFHKRKEESVSTFEQEWSGVALMAYPQSDSKEPNYGKNHLFELAERAKTIVLLLCVLFLATFGIITADVWEHVSTILLMLVNIAGIGVTWLLILKTLKVHSSTGDRICGVLQEHGCDTVLEQKASTFFGLFSWSEVGFTYFSMTTLILILFPQYINYLALINGCCLPFTVWSIWYQKTRIKTWCTLCVTTQTLLWLQFFCFLFGGWWSGAFPLRLPFFLICAAFTGVMLTVNRVMTFIKGRK